MKISVCIPQYNRIAHLVKNLETISRQTWKEVEVVISDDCSTDQTTEEIEKLKKNYPFPIVYQRNSVNQGYDRNFRRSLELANGDYCFVLGNDDTFHHENDLESLAGFLLKNKCPEIGFCNYLEDKNRSEIFQRAFSSSVVGSGFNSALRYYRSFSFVAGTIWRRDWFLKINTDKFDKSVYAQIYLAMRIILEGGRLFLISEPMVVKDIEISGHKVNSYRDRLPRTWKEYRVTDGGLPRVIRVSIEAFHDSGYNRNKVAYVIMKNIYSITLPYWVFDYKSNNALTGALGLIVGMWPGRIPETVYLSFFNKIRLYTIYSGAVFLSLIIPGWLFGKIKTSLYRMVKK